MRILFVPNHGQAAIEVAVLCRSAGIALDIAGNSNNLMWGKLPPVEQIQLRRHDVESPTDKEVLDLISSNRYSAVIVSSPGQVVQFRRGVQPLRPRLPLINRHGINCFSQLQDLNIQNFYSPSPRALSIMGSCHTLRTPKLLDWDLLAAPSHEPQRRCGSGLYIHYYARYWPRAWRKFRELNSLLGPHAVTSYGMENEGGIVHDLEVMRRSRATLHLKDSGICCFAVLRSMAMATPVVMDRETHERCFFDGISGILVRESIPAVADELRRLALDDEYWTEASKAAYRAAREQTSFPAGFGQTFREFVANARPDVGRDFAIRWPAPQTVNDDRQPSGPASWFDLMACHEWVMGRLIRLHGKLLSGCAAVVGHSHAFQSSVRARRRTVSCLIGGCRVRLPEEFVGEGLERWELEPLQQIRDFLAGAGAPLVIDVGSSLGWVSCMVLFAHHQARVVAIDSDLQSVAATRSACASAPLARKRLVSVHGFVSDRPTSCHDYLQEAARTAALLRGQRVSGAPQATRYRVLGSKADDGSIPRHSLDGLFWKRVHAAEMLIKCDVEGAELHVLRGASALLQALRPTLLLSIHHKQLQQYGHSEQQVEKHLLAHGYSIQRLQPDHEQHWLCRPTASRSKSLA